MRQTDTQIFKPPCEFGEVSPSPIATRRKAEPGAVGDRLVGQTPVVTSTSPVRSCAAAAIGIATRHARSRPPDAKAATWRRIASAFVTTGFPARRLRDADNAAYQLRRPRPPRVVSVVTGGEIVDRETAGRIGHRKIGRVERHDLRGHLRMDVAEDATESKRVERLRPHRAYRIQAKIEALAIVI